MYLSNDLLLIDHQQTAICLAISEHIQVISGHDLDFGNYVGHMIS